MRTTIDAAGRLVVPKDLREQLGFAPGTELELQAVDGRLEVDVPSRVAIEDGPHGRRLSAAAETPLTSHCFHWTFRAQVTYRRLHVAFVALP